MHPQFPIVAAWLAIAAIRPVAQEMLPLFNGRDLAGWVNVNCAPETFRATNGIVSCTGFPTGILRTERMYQNFIVELEWRHLKAGGNSGFYIWSDPVTARGQPFTRAVEVQVLDGREGAGFTSDGDIFPIHGAKMVPENGRGGDRAFPIEKRMKPSPEWNHYRVECVDGNISLAVNGKVVTRGHQSTPRKGYLGLESEGSPAEFRNLRIRELPATHALAPVDIAEPAEGFRPLYTGIDLRGWRADGDAAASWVVQDWTLSDNGTGTGLTSTTEYGDGALIVDFRWPDKNRTGDWRQLLSTRFGTLLGSFAPGSPRAEKPPGEWNRLRATFRGDRWSLNLNGTDLSTGDRSPGVPPKGVITLRPGGWPVQFANLYWKDLD